jgi:hypothetical protein
MHKTPTLAGAALIITLFGLTPAWAAKASKKEPVVEVALSEAGAKLETKYAEQLKTLKAEITAALPAVDDAAKQAFLSAYQTEATAIAEEQKLLLAAGSKKLKDPADKAAATKAHEDAIAAAAVAVKSADSASQAVLKSLATVISSDRLDAQLVKCAVLSDATPRGLAVFAEKSPEHASLVDQLLSDVDLMRQMLVAGGAQGGAYGEAMRIYNEIQKASPKAKSGVLQRLAVGVSVEHALPAEQTNALEDTQAPKVVDPVKRYLHFEKAYAAGELDPCFEKLSAWDYRNVVNGNEPDAILTWGREMLRNYRPDIISTSDQRWRYSKSVKTDVKYGSQDQKNDSPALHPFQNMINTGGVCGRRAFFGRFILRAFGVPTLARPQPGHATLVRWTPDGWLVNLGASWGWGRVEGESDLDFLAMTQARRNEAAYVEVQRARWIGTALGEKKAYGFHSEVSGFWNGLALYHQRAIIEASKAKALGAVGTDIGEANESKEADLVEEVKVTDEDKKIVVGKDGAITIPAVACAIEGGKSEKILFMKSSLGGLQMHYGRLGTAEVPFSYTIEAPEAGTYALRARVVTVSPNQSFQVSANDAKEPVVLAMPYTIGAWGTTEPVQVSLVKGMNVLKFSRSEAGKGTTIKDLTLTPLK